MGMDFFPLPVLQLFWPKLLLLQLDSNTVLRCCCRQLTAADWTCTAGLPAP